MTSEEQTYLVNEQDYQIDEEESSLQEERDPAVLRRCVVLKYLSAFTDDTHVIRYLQQYGNVEKISFVTIPSRIYMKTCIVKMGTEHEAQKILEKTFHEIYITLCVIEMYNGDLASLHIRGKFKVSIERLGSMVPKKMSRQQLCEHLEMVFMDTWHNGIELITNEAGICEGYVDIRFITEEGRTEAIEICQKESFLFKIPKKKKLEEDSASESEMQVNTPSPSLSKKNTPSPRGKFKKKQKKSEMQGNTPSPNGQFKKKLKNTHTTSKE